MDPPSPSHRPRQRPVLAPSSGRRFYNRFHLLGSFLLGCCSVTAAFTLLHLSTLSDLHDVSADCHSSTLAHHPGKIAKEHKEQLAGPDVKQHPRDEEKAKKFQADAKNRQKLAANHDSVVHPVAGLDCSEHGGPASEEDSKELVYWRDIPGDNGYKSPFLKEGERRYLTFEPDSGGWNNIRMGMETVLTMALAMGRVLVLPPAQRMYLLGGKKFNFADFFPLQELAEEHDGLEIITTQQFLEETMGKTRDNKTGQISHPPGNRVTWDGDTNAYKAELAPWIRSVSTMADWDVDKCIAAFPKSTDPHDTESLQQAMDEIKAEEHGKFLGSKASEYFMDKPTDVDAGTKDRLREMIAERKDLCMYDAALQQAEILHFHGKASNKRVKIKEPGARLLVHFYAFLFFQDWRTDLLIKRFVRDHVRYIDDVQCAAARVVKKLRDEHGGAYDSFHVRRGDFQYKKTRLDASEILKNSQDVIKKGRTVYIGTDERDKSFFQPLKDAGWKVLFLDNFLDTVGKSVDSHYYGMIDQLVVSRGDHFFGCWFSTFTGYIMRLRGYHSQAEAETSPHGKEFLQGRLPNSYYYALKDHRTRMHQYWPVRKSFYAREFPASWRQLDKVV